MKKALRQLALAPIALAWILALPALAEEAEGNWTGLLAGQLHLVFHITKAGDGQYFGELESVDQGGVKIATYFRGLKPALCPNTGR